MRPGGEMGGESLARELLREAGGEVLKHHKLDQDGVARGPRRGPVGEQAELDGEAAALGGDGGVHSARVDLQPVALIGGQDGDGAVGGGAQLQAALQAVVIQQGAAKNGGKLAGGVAAQQVHLPQAVLGGDEALGKDEVVHGGGADVGHAAGVAFHRDRRGEAVDGERAVELRQVLAHRNADEVAPGEERGRGERGGEHQKQAEDAQLVARAAACERIEVGYEGGFECGVCSDRVFRRGVRSGAVLHPAHESLVAQVGFGGIGGGVGPAGVRVVAAHGLRQV